MKDKIKVDGIEYVKFSKYKDLQKSKIKNKIVKEIKEVEKIIEKEVDKIKLKDYMIIDSCNICGIYPIKKDNQEFTELETDLGLFKEIENKKILIEYSDDYSESAIVINNTKYSKEYFDSIRKIAGVWFSDKPIIFKRYDKDKKEFLKNEPVMLVFDYKICFILAPRVESEDGE